jgi:chloramphenicol 3-O-phosphotransferase
MHAMIAAAAKSGQNMVVDHLMFCDPPVLQDAIWQMADVPVLFVNLKPSREVLEDRVRNRQIDVIPAPIQEAMASAGADSIAAMGAQLAALGDWFYEHTYANDVYDLELDSSTMNPEQVCQAIEARLAEGPGTAFARLRERYPRG